MPRNYTRKTDKGNYSLEKLQDAIHAVKSGRMSAYTASKHYNIPRPTIVNRIYERRGFKSNTLGRNTILSRETEESLAKNLHFMEKYGFGLTRKELLEVVGDYVNQNCIVNPFKNGVPGEDWFLGFKKRHLLSVKKPQPVEYARKNACRPDIIYPYFDLLEMTISELDLHDKPAHIYNVDETSFSKDPSKSKVVGLKGFTSTRTISSPGKDNTTVLLGCNALGEKLPPLIIYKGKNVWDEWTSQEGYPGTVYAATSNGWMESAVFEQFFDKVFLPFVGQKRPILLIYDGHSTHVGLNIIEKARAAGITVLKIPPHTSDVLQPLDLSVNKSFKDKWDAALVKWQRQNVGKVLPKKDFSRMIGQIWSAVEPKVCLAGFKKAGIYPLNKNAVPEEKFNQILLQAWKSKITESEAPGEIAVSALQVVTGSQELNQPEIAASALQVDTRSQESNQPEIAASALQVDTGSQESNQPGILKKMVLTSINNVISGSHAPASQQSCCVHGGQNYLLKNKPSTSSSLNESSGARNAFQVSLQNCVAISRYHDISLKNNPVSAATSDSHTTSSNTCTIPKVNILENRVISFEELLLKSVKGGTATTTKKRKVATGAELITNDDVYNRCRMVEAEKEQKLREKEQKAKKREEKTKAKELLKKTKQIKDNKTKIKEEQPGRSGLCTTIQEKSDSVDCNSKTQWKTSKGKGVGKKTYLSKENIPDIIMRTQKNKKRNKRIRRTQESDGSTTSISDTMSDHTDSSIFDVQSNAETDEDQIESEKNYESWRDSSTNVLETFQSQQLYSDGVFSPPAIDSCQSRLSETLKAPSLPPTDATSPHTSGVWPQNMSENSVAFLPHSSNVPLLKPVSKRAAVIENNDYNDIYCSSDQVVAPHSSIVQKTSTYSVNDNVLVRYFMKRTWKYYIGVVTACNDNGSYDISFYTTSRNKGELMFKTPKKKDRDTVPHESVVKSIQIQKISDKPEVYTLQRQDDKNYF